jgi:hypothetical protein
METILRAVAMQAARKALVVPDLQAAVLGPPQALHLLALVPAPDQPLVPTRHQALVRRQPVRILHRRAQALRPNLPDRLLGQDNFLRRAIG